MQQMQANRLWKGTAFGGVLISAISFYEPMKDLYLKVYDPDYKGIVSVPFAEQQLALADKNAECFLNMRRSRVQVNEEVAISYGACPNHNVHIGVYPKDRPAYQRWLEPNRETELAQSAGLFPAAFAGFSGTLPAPATPSSVTTPVQVELKTMCQEWQDEQKRKILRITDEGGEQCVFERVNVLSGVVEVREEAACDAQCKVEAEKYN